MTIINAIEELIAEVTELQKPSVQRSCPVCIAPCCQRVHYVYNAKDILFLRLSGRKRTWRKDVLTTTGCWFLGSKGCILEPVSRPMLCHCYRCVELEAEMNRRDPDLLPALKAKFKQINVLRNQMHMNAGT